MGEDQESLQDLKEQFRELREELRVLEQYRSGYADLEKSLAETRAFLDTLTSSVLEPIVILGWEGDILYANAAAFRLAGVDPSTDLSKLNAFSFVAADDHRTLSENLGRVRDRDERFITLYRLVTSTGEIRWLEAFGNRVVFRGREANMVTIRDVTERKRTEDALRERQAQFDSLFRAVPTGIGTVTGQVLTHVNEHISKMTGYSREELLGQSASILYPTRADYKFVGKERDRQLKEEGIGSLETRWKRKDGSVIDVSLIFSPLVPGDPGAGVTFTALDITRRKILDRTLKESEERYRRITSTITDYIFTVVFEEGRAVQTIHSPACEVITGYTPEDFDSDPYLWLDMVHEDDRDMVIEHINGVLSDSSTPTIEHRIRRKDGSIRWVSNTPVINRDSSGAMISYDGVISDITARKSAEEALRKSEERFKGIARNLPGVVYQFYARDNGESGLSYMNERSLEILGLKNDLPDIFERGIEGIAPEYRKKFFSSIRRAVRTVSTWDFEFRFIRPDGKEIYIRGVSQPERLDHEVVFNGVLLDVTDRKRAEIALRESREFYHSLFENNNAVMLLINPKTLQIADANPAACTFYGYPRKKLRSMTIDRINTLAPDRIRTAIEHAGANGTYHFFFRHRLASGEIRDVEVYAAPIETGGETVLYSIIHDITERKRAEEALRRNEERFRSLIQNSSDIIVILNDQGVFTYEIPSVSRILGYEPGYLIGKRPVDFIHEEDLEIVRAELEEVYRNTNSGIPTEMRLRKADGSWVYLEAIGKNLLDFSGINGVVVTARDITDRKKAEKERIDMERRFQHAQKLESLGVMAGGIAHDFNNLLMAILGNLDLALFDLPSSSRSRRFIDQARSAAHRAADLTNQMLAYSGKGTFDIKSFDLSEFVEEMARLLEASISKTVTLSLQMDRSLPRMMADPGQIQQIIMNLIVNASEAIGEKAGVVTIATGLMDCSEACLEQSRLKEKPGPGKYIYIEVKDTGCGMDEGTRERLFDPFFSTKFTGRGLGMSAVLGIVKGHKGAIMVESEPGMGTAIRVLFPVPDAGPADTVEGLSPARSAAEVTEQPASGTVLVVDDEEMVLELCKTMIELMGYSVLTASDGKEALAVFREHSDEIACVILDLTMPRMDGITAFQAMKGAKSDARVIISSGYSVDEVATRFQGSKPSGFIKKPFELKVLQKEIERVIMETS